MKGLFNDNKMYGEKLSSKGWLGQIIIPLLLWLGLSVVASAVVLIFYMVTISNLNIEEYQKLLENDGAMYVQLLSQVLFLIAFFLLYKKDKKYYPKVVKSAPKYVLIFGSILILAIGILFGYFIELLEYLIPNFGEGYKSVESFFTSGGFLFAFVSTCLLAPILEELLCRGILLNRLLSKKTVWFSIIVSSFCFGLIHLNLLQGVYAFIIGIVLAIVYIKTRSLWPCILGHALNNFISITTMSIDSKLYYIITGVLIILSIYPIVRFIKDDRAYINKNQLLDND